MRTSVLTRATLGAVSIAVASSALTAGPANAAPSNGIVRAEALQISGALRAPGDSLNPADDTLLDSIFDRGCGVGPKESGGWGDAAAVDVPGNADGFVVSGDVYDSVADKYRGCTFGVFATTDAAATLSGAVSLAGKASESAPAVTLSTESLSGDVFVTSRFNQYAPAETYYDLVTATVAGDAVRTVTRNVPKPAMVPATAAQREAAKVRYTKRLTFLKKQYKKSLAKAGNNKQKKKAAKRAYTAERKRAKDTYRSRLGDRRGVIYVATPGVIKNPISVSATSFVYYD